MTLVGVVVGDELVVAVFILHFLGHGGFFEFNVVGHQLPPVGGLFGWSIPLLVVLASLALDHLHVPH